MFTLAELKLLIEAVGTLTMEYGERPERVAMEEKLRAMRDARIAEIEEARR